jgi:hypothetical protein
VQISTDSFTLLGTADFGKVLPEDLTGLPSLELVNSV